MKNLFYSFFILLAFTNCKAQDLVLRDSKDLTNNYDLFDKYFESIDILKDVTEKTNYSIYNEDGFYFLQGEGKKSNNRVVTFRVKFEKYKVSESTSSLLNAIEAETCTGKDCEKCVFAKKGGCDCERGSGSFGVGSCDHSITRLTRYTGQ